ncbi:MAG: hypothetical protein ACOC16_03800 [Nanoarchaeota archaeon]
MKQKKLEKVVCELDPKTKLPKHSKEIPKKNLAVNIPKLYCYDSRREECFYYLEHNNKTYCSYKN